METGVTSTGGVELWVGNNRTGCGTGSGDGETLVVPALCAGARSGVAATAACASPSVTSVTPKTTISLTLRGSKTFPNAPHHPAPTQAEGW